MASLTRKSFEINIAICNFAGDSIGFREIVRREQVSLFQRLQLIEALLKPVTGSAPVGNGFGFRGSGPRSQSLEVIGELRLGVGKSENAD
ncbi:MAG: hypothetical protein WAL45_12870, partial [Terracidiphilus sp.]